MRLSEKLRKYTFWFLDVLKGKNVSQHYNDLRLLSKLNASDKELYNRLDCLLTHAPKTTGFYSKYLNNTINNYPVINKNIIRNNLSDFRSSGFCADQLFPMITSGSTGTPFKIYHDVNKRKRNSADTIYFAKEAGYEVGNKLYYFKIWSDYNRKSKLQQWVQNIVPVDVINLQNNCSGVVAELNSNKFPVSLIGYVSAFDTLCKYIEENNIKIKIKVNSIITMSESLDEFTKDRIQKIFSCPVFSRYSNIENGIIAQQTIKCPDYFLVNTASYLVEIFNLNNDIPLEFGKSGRIVVTDYFNYAYPMIRYDTGDIGQFDEIEINGVKKLVLKNIEGRKLDLIYNTKGDLISSYIVYKNMWRYTEINQYQLIQNDKKEFIFKICMNNTFAREKELVNEFKEYLGKDAIISVEYVREIPLLNSGKRKKVVNLMTAKNDLISPITN